MNEQPIKAVPLPDIRIIETIKCKYCGLVVSRKRKSKVFCNARCRSAHYGLSHPRINLAEK